MGIRVNMVVFCDPNKLKETTEVNLALNYKCEK